MRGDLHCHTTCSDGSMSPEDVVHYASRIGLDCLAVTDHDTMEGISAARAKAKECGIRLISGMEVSTYDYQNGRQAHLLCYRPQRPEKLIEVCARTIESRRRAALRMIEKVSQKYPIDLEAVKPYAKGGMICKQHIAMALADRGYSLSVFGELFHELFSKKDGWARVEISYPETRDVLRLIREAGSIAVLAHPGVYGNFGIIGELSAMGLDGVEACHPRQTAEHEKAAFEAAEQYGLIPTGGSDFHGFFSARVNPLAARTAPEEGLSRFLKLYGEEGV